MFSKSSKFFFALLAVSLPEMVLGREVLLEREGRAVSLYPRRFGAENPPVIAKISAACPGQVCGVLSGKAITPLLAAQPECSQQDMADEIIDASRQFDAATQANMIALAIEYRQAEKNTPPDFTTNPPSLRNSVFCQKAPKNPELNGLVQAQDPNNDPNLFFDPATKATVTLGSQPNTFPFGGAGAAVPPAPPAPAPEAPAVDTPPAETPAPPVAAPPAGGIGDFGSCTVPQIEFAVGFDNRRESSFRPVDLVNFNHGSAQNINIITRFVCDQLVNRCGADQTARNTCASAITAAAAAEPAKTGIQADAFNAVFGITTDFANVQAFDDQGRPFGPTVGGGAATPAPAPQTPDAPAAETPAAPATRPCCWWNCFRPVDLVNFNHGSAQNFKIISQFVCDTLVNRCGADQTARNTCAAARAAADAATAGNGIQADTFNSFFGKTTNFAAIQPLDNQGRAVGAPITGGVAAPAPAPVVAAPAPVSTPASCAAPAPVAAAPAAPAAGNLQSFTGALGGILPPTVTEAGAGVFQVQNNASFNNLNSALRRSCDVQVNLCSNAANASGNQGDLTVANCGAQGNQCRANL
ncbi:hypothetical protein ONZ45_g283 [Pleurotus djamor]|nr:hypothetical protein ONZ45_g283 [Pleurotus djamor]